MTAIRRTPATNSGFSGAAPLFPLVAGLEKIDSDLVAIDPGKFASAIGKPRRRQQQKEFLQVQSLDRALDCQLGPGLGNVFHDAIAAPRAVDAHHVRVKSALERDTLTSASLCH